MQYEIRLKVNFDRKWQVASQMNDRSGQGQVWTFSTMLASFFE